MKFRLSFKVHSELFVQGSREILVLPGLIAFSAYGGMLKVRPLWGSNTFYISSQYLAQSGWNEVELNGDGASIVLVVNRDYTWTLVDGNSAPMNWVSGFTLSNYLKFPTFPCDSTKYNITIPFKLNNNTDTSYLLCNGYSSANSIEIFIEASTGKLCYRACNYSGSGWSLTLKSSEAMPINTRIICNVIKDNSEDTKQILRHSIDGGQTWVVDGTSTSSLSSWYSQNYQWRLGTWVYSDTYQYYLHGELDFYNTVLTANDQTILNGATAVLNTDYSVQGSLTFVPENIYPRLSLGQLNTYQNSWLVLKDIEALKLEE